ncbi:hypothetical protein AM571_PA00240 (plasmid) [Rhizobium etli 8C-3]|uniref:Uncharacterized protein n=1 Tax=Rhizobium etli 8C-3 TaxID=538025 RepID=A0A1L5PAC2_RHIET|nr:hypothetical protein AM571_PA00240 [Rhizobium etli 8C-3]
MPRRSLRRLDCSNYLVVPTFLHKSTSQILVGELFSDRVHLSGDINPDVDLLPIVRKLAVHNRNARTFNSSSSIDAELSAT